MSKKENPEPQRVQGKSKLEKIVALTKRRGFIYPGSEIYGGLGGTWDYGPLGVELKNNVKRAWWKDIVWMRDDMVGLDAAILMQSKTWEASGHVSGFTDPLIDCKNCKKRFRADHLVEGLADSGKLDEHGEYSLSDIKKMAELLKNKECPECGRAELTEPRSFNLMFKTFVGPVEDSSAQVWLRPETAQGIFVNFKNVLDTTPQKLPFGIAQIGKAFRNEINPGNFTFRSREFEQMEIEYFVKPGTDEQWHKHWLEERVNWYKKYGLSADKLRLREHEKDELAHYAKQTFDVEYKMPFGWSELEGIANRTDFDLSQHEKFSGKELKYFDEETKEKIIPYVIEPSAGADRATLAFLVDAYSEEETKEGVRVVMKFHPQIAPVKVAVFPLMANKPELVEKAKEVFGSLRKHWFCAFDDIGNVGKRYRRQDEIGTPWCVTVDYDSLKDNTVTVRDRDSMEQERVKVDELVDYFRKKLED